MKKIVFIALFTFLGLYANETPEVKTDDSIQEVVQEAVSEEDRYEQEEKLTQEEPDEEKIYQEELREIRKAEQEAAGEAERETEQEAETETETEQEAETNEENVSEESEGVPSEQEGSEVQKEPLDKNSEEQSEEVIGT